MNKLAFSRNGMLVGSPTWLKIHGCKMWNSCSTMSHNDKFLGDTKVRTSGLFVCGIDFWVGFQTLG